MVEFDLVALVGNLGFPVVVTFFVLFRLEKAINRNTEAIDNLKLFLKK